MLNRINELITNLIEKHVLYSFIVVYALSITTCVLLILFVQSKDGSIVFDSVESESEMSSENDKEANIFVEISGAVTDPGVFELESGSRIVKLIKLAGGFSKEASEEWISRYINLATPLNDSQKIYIPYKWDDLGKSPEIKVGDLLTLVKPYIVEENQSHIFESNVKQGSSDAVVTANTLGSTLININTASQEDIDELPGIGPAYATRFIENRPYSGLEDLKEKSGVSASVIEKIKDLITY